MQVIIGNKRYFAVPEGKTGKCNGCCFEVRMGTTFRSCHKPVEIDRHDCAAAHTVFNESLLGTKEPSTITREELVELLSKVTGTEKIWARTYLNLNFPRGYSVFIIEHVGDILSRFVN